MDLSDAIQQICSGINLAAMVVTDLISSEGGGRAILLEGGSTGSVRAEFGLAPTLPFALAAGIPYGPGTTITVIAFTPSSRVAITISGYLADA